MAKIAQAVVNFELLRYFDSWDGFNKFIIHAWLNGWTPKQAAQKLMEAKNGHA